MDALRQLFEMAKATFKSWQQDRATRLAAALAYYAVFAIGPILLIAVTVAGYFLGQQNAQNQITSTAEKVIGQQGAQGLRTLLQNTSGLGSNFFFTLVGVGALFVTASGLFAHLQDALNTVWEVTIKQDASIWVRVRDRALSFILVLASGLLLFASVILNSSLAVVRGVTQNFLPTGALWLWQVAGYGGSAVLITFVFAMIYKLLPDVRVNWQDVWIGAAVTSALFVLGQIALGIYFGTGSAGSAYGAAGSVVIIMIWVYYSALIMLFGAEFTQVYARMCGSRIVPKEYATYLTPPERAQQGTGTKELHPRKQTNSPRERVSRGGQHRRLSPWFK